MLLRKSLVFSLMAVAAIASFSQFAVAATDIDAKAHEVAKSIVIVEYTARNENLAREEAGQGLVVSKDGVILIPGAFIPEALPKEWLKAIKVRVPSNNFAPVSAQFLGRTKDRLFAFIKVDKPIDVPVFIPGDSDKPTFGEEVFSVGMLNKAAGYETYVGINRVKTILDLTHTIVAVGTNGLTRSLSPVFDLESGKFVGITTAASPQVGMIRDSNGPHAVQIADDDQSSSFFPASEVSSLFENIPTAKYESPRAWIGLDETTGLPEDVRTLKKIKQTCGVMIGSVIPGQAADKAGIQAQDIVLTINGKEFSHSPIPELMVMHFSRALEKLNVGDKVELGILRDDKPMNITVTMTQTPKNAADMPHVFSAKVGITTRDLVFADAYARKLPQDTKGVMIQLVKQGAPASLGSTPLRPNEIVTKVNDTTIENQAQFLDAMKKIEDATDQKEAVFVVTQTDGNTQVCHIDLSK